MNSNIWLMIIFLLMHSSTNASGIIWKVNKNGKAQFTSIQEAINHIPDSSHPFITIQISEGVYEEKLLIKKSNFELVGADIDKTIITQSIARDEWRCEHNDDWGVATVNVDSASIINFKNITIENSYGFITTEPKNIICKLDSDKAKIVQITGHQMAFRSFSATKLKFVNCHFKAWGGDTMSPWNTNDGMFYLYNCLLEGGVDFYCPRGWAYAEQCKFISHNGPAAIWHDGSLHEDAKSVLVECSFSGFDQFLLGRFHRDAQIYLVKCHFPANMADQTIYQVKTNNKLSWPGRIYYYECDKAGVSNNFFNNNIDQAKEKPADFKFTADWVFQTRWNALEQ